MGHFAVASRYARALYERAREEGVVTRVDEDMDVVWDVLQSAPLLVDVLKNPLIPREKKVAVFERLLAEQVHPLVVGLLRLVVRKRREALFPDIVEAYRRMRDERLGILDVWVTVAHQLDTNEIEQLKKRLESFTGKHVRLHLEEDPRILGGVIVRIQDRVYDRSVRTQLERLRVQLAGLEME